MTGDADGLRTPVSPAEWEQAAFWRDAVIERLARAADALREAEAGCSVSVERVQVARALTETTKALRTARSGAAECRRRARQA